jgi:hypothetical protein
MTATATTAAPPQAERPAAPERWWLRPSLIGPTLFGIGNAIVWFIVRPGVNDLWAARARASAVRHGVGLDYWFSWFGGGSTPGNYSIVTPYLCAAIGTEVVGALSAVAAVVLVCIVLRNTPHETTAAWYGAIGVLCTMWSGRIPFLLGSAFAIGALVAVRHGKRSLTVVLTLLSIAASPLAGAFLVLGLSGTFLTTRTKAYRPIIAYAAVTAGLALLLSSLAFGTPGPQPFTDGLFLELCVAFVVLFAGPPDHLRTMFWVTVIAVVVLWAIPNGVGSNIARFVWFCLPVAVLALSRLHVVVSAVLVTPLVFIGAFTTGTDVRHAYDPAASGQFYKSLADRLDRIPDLETFRVELVDHGARAGYEALLDHAMLARGWETQEDTALNRALTQDPLNPITYKAWLDNNAVGYVALPSSTAGPYPEYKLVASGPPSYLTRIWWNTEWDLFRVEDPTPIVAPPASVLAHDQKSMTLRIPCDCALAVRLHYSRFLTAVLQHRDALTGKLTDATPTERATVADDGTGWTVLTTHEPGIYLLRGSLTSGLLH